MSVHCSELITVKVTFDRFEDDWTSYEIVAGNAERPSETMLSDVDWFVEGVHNVGIGDALGLGGDVPEYGEENVVITVTGRIKSIVHPSTPDGPAEYDEEFEIDKIEPNIKLISRKERDKGLEKENGATEGW